MTETGSENDVYTCTEYGQFLADCLSDGDCVYSAAVSSLRSRRGRSAATSPRHASSTASGGWSRREVSSTASLHSSWSTR